MDRIFILTDYKGYFGSKWDSEPYRSGFDKDLLKKYFAKNGVNAIFLNFSDINNPQELENKYVLYTSSEIIGYKYKSYIEDIIYSLELSGAILLPEYKFLRANNNKVFMSLLEKQLLKDQKILKSKSFGTYDDFIKQIDNITYPSVIKKSEGYMSMGVFLAKNKSQAIKICKKISITRNFYQDIWDKLRLLKHKNYKKNTLYRKKFIIQEFVPNLKNDWKILIYGDKYFVLTRHVRINDFRASGSGKDYLAGSKAIIPDGLLDFAKNVFESLKVPNLSIDVVYNGNDFYLLEFQALYFGTATYSLSDVYFKKDIEKWKQIPNVNPIEEIYVESIIQHIKKGIL